MYFRINVTAGGTKFRLGQQKPRFVALAEAMDGLLLCAKNEETASEILVSRVVKGEGAQEELANELAEEGRFWFGGHRWTLTEHVDYDALYKADMEQLFEEDIEQGFKDLEKIQEERLSQAATELEEMADGIKDMQPA